jgi:hypothetical protein
MVGRILRAMFTLLLYFSLATLIAETIVVGHLVSHWQIDAGKLGAMIAAAQGIELPRAGEAARPEPETPSTEQVSYDQVLEARAVKDKNLQLRELALANALAQFRSDQRKLSEEQTRYAAQRRDYEGKLDATSKGALATGREQVASLLQSLKPKQAKDILLNMLENNEMDEVVLLLSGMADAKRAKIVSEFKTADETKKIEEVMRQIRQGIPVAPLADQAKQQLGQPAQTAGVRP